MQICEWVQVVIGGSVLHEGSSLGFGSYIFISRDQGRPVLCCLMLDQVVLSNDPSKTE